jgi:bacillithiol system protein YtxJ
MAWNNLTNLEQLNSIAEESNTKAQLIFKHSTRCSVSSFAKRILNDEINNEYESKIDFHYLDLIAFREVSNAIASKFNVFHESPQILLIQNGKCTYHASHSDITLEKLDVLL